MGLFDSLRGALDGAKVAKAFAAFEARRQRPAIHSDADGIGVTLDPDHPDFIEPLLSWLQVRRVTALKRDLAARDLICLQFEAASHQVYEVHEEMVGWHDLIASLPRHLPGCLTEGEMLEKVMNPPFAANETVIFRRD
ncbi:MAG TPA: hypothetical protein VFD06_00750 [Candidatus Polarisedimenticolia bacterium]|nr:hypothetical protein [Candidatus Polarisedimenticolia bacterium]